jgi:hypothetical protein
MVLVQQATSALLSAIVSKQADNAARPANIVQKGTFALSIRTANTAAVRISAALHMSPAASLSH